MQRIKEISVLQVSDSSFIVRSEVDSNGQPAPVINTSKDFPGLINLLQETFFSIPTTASPTPATTQ